MRKNRLKQIIKDGGRIVNGWCAIPSSYAAEIYSHCGWDSVTLDLQHGPIDFTTALPMLQAISTTDAVPLCRVPWNDAAIIMKLLDAGAYGLICPMINTKEEAEQFVSFGRYPPIGTRSMGPNRAVQYGGADYWQGANEECLLLAMIETQAGVKNLESILSVKGLNGVYVGPSDLSLAMGKPPTLDPSDPGVIETIAHIAKVTRSKGLIAGVHTDGPATAKKRFEQGYNFVTLMNDARSMTVAVTNMVKETRGESERVTAKTY